MAEIFSERLRQVRESLGMSKKDFADYLGLNPANITRYENDLMGVSVPAAEEMAKKLQINPAWLIGWPGNRYLTNDTPVKHVPILGRIAAGEPIIAHENIEGYEIVPEGSGIDFCLRVKGDSMIGARIYDNDVVCIKKQAEVENGEIAAVMIGDEAATLKRFYRLDSAIILKPENIDYKDMVFTKKDQKKIKVLGKAVWLKGDVR